MIWLIGLLGGAFVGFSAGFLVGREARGLEAAQEEHDRKVAILDAKAAALDAKSEFPEQE